MKKILVPTDFSAEARKALDLALRIGAHASGEITLLHCYQLPVVPTRHLHMNNVDEATHISIKAEALLNEEKEYGEKKTGTNISSLTIPIYMATEIPTNIIAANADLIVMGTRGAGGLKKFFLGSNTATVIVGSAKPVLAVPAGEEEVTVRKIGFAYDHEPTEDCESLRMLRDLADIFEAHTEIFHLITPRQVADPGNREENISRIQELFGSSSNEYIEWPETDLEAGIHNFISERNIDLLAMMPRNRSIFQRLFRSSLTKQMAYSSAVPLLAIPSSA